VTVAEPRRRQITYSHSKGYFVDISKLISDLKTERDRIDQAITALEGLTSSTTRRGRPPKATSTFGIRRRMSPAARKRISVAMKRRWATMKRKRNGGGGIGG